MVETRAPRHYYVLTISSLPRLPVIPRIRHIQMDLALDLPPAGIQHPWILASGF